MIRFPQKYTVFLAKVVDSAYRQVARLVDVGASINLYNVETCCGCKAGLTFRLTRLKRRVLRPGGTRGAPHEHDL